jgi:hypothetical protein
MPACQKIPSQAPASWPLRSRVPSIQPRANIRRQCGHSFASSGPNPDPSPQDLPRTWDEIVPGHLVIARETLEVGWWEAVVVERNGDLVTVRYRD